MPLCHHLSDEMKEEFHGNENLDRSSTHSKTTYLMNNAEEMILVLDHKEKLLQKFNKNKILALFKHIGLFINLIFYLSILINVLILISYESNEEQRRD